MAHLTNDLDSLLLFFVHFILNDHLTVVATDMPLIPPSIDQLHRLRIQVNHPDDLVPHFENLIGQASDLRLKKSVHFLEVILVAGWFAGGELGLIAV